MREEKDASTPFGAALALENVSVAFGGLKALSDVSFTVPAGGIFGLIGPNGAGKTTVFNAISGVYRPAAGKIVLTRGEGAHDLVGSRPFEVVAAGVARTFQNLRLFHRLSVIDHLLLALDRTNGRARAPKGARYVAPKGARYKEAQKREHARDLLAIFALDARADALAASLPYGDQRRLEIARALATGARLLLLDEPAAGMNPQETAALMGTVQALRARFGATILLIEHDMKLVMGICERIAVLDHGVKIAEGTPSEVRANPAVIEAYLGKAAY